MVVYCVTTTIFGASYLLMRLKKKWQVHKTFVLWNEQGRQDGFLPSYQVLDYPTKYFGLFFGGPINTSPTIYGKSTLPCTYTEKTSHDQKHFFWS